MSSTRTMQLSYTECRDPSAVSGSAGYFKQLKRVKRTSNDLFFQWNQQQDEVYRLAKCSMLSRKEYPTHDPA